MRIFMICTALIFSLSACDTRPLNELTYAEQQKMLIQFNATCLELGIDEKHTKYQECVQTEINAENARRSGQSAGMTSLGQGLSQASTNYSNSYRAPITCNTRPAVGWGSATTTCY